MYDFRDIQITNKNNSYLPPEALTIDGKTIEKVIPEYMTLNVSGREMLGQTLTTLKVGNQNGERLQRATKPSRTITVKYRIDCDSKERFREVFYQLNAILNGTEKEISFADDPNKYYIGTLSDVETVESGVTSTVSTFSFYCADPYAYEKTEDKFSFSDAQTAEQYDFSASDMSIFKGYELGNTLTQAPDYYTEELTQAEYAKLNSADNDLVSSVSSSSHVSNINDYGNAFKDLGDLNMAKIEDGKLKISGWFADNSSTWRKYAYIIVSDEDWSNEHGRVKVELTDRPDVQKVYPNIANSGKCGFVGEIPFNAEMGNRNLRVHFRYSADESGNTNYVNWSTLIYTTDLWTYQSPRLVAKFNVLNSLSDFWKKTGITGTVEQLTYLKTKINSLSLKAWCYGKNVSQNYVGLAVWDSVNNTWSKNLEHTQNTPTMLESSFKNADEITNFIDANGNMYFNVYSKSAENKTVSDAEVFLDYLQATLNVDIPVSDSLTVINNCYEPVPIRFEILNKSDNGYIGISNKKQNYLLGSVEAENTSTDKKSVRIFTTNQDNSNGLKQWTINDGVVNPWNSYPTQQGAFEDPSIIKESRWRLRNAQSDFVTAWGSGQAGTDLNSPGGGSWHGPSASATFSDSSIKNFTARFYAQALHERMEQHGLQEFNIWSGDKSILASVQMWKWINGHNGIKIRVGDNWAYVDENNERWDNFFGSITIKRFENTYTIEVENVEGSGPKTKQTISFDDAESAKKMAGGVTYWKARKGTVSNQLNVMYNDLYDFWLNKDNVTSYTDIPNQFSDGDIIKVDADENKVTTTVNGTSAIGLQDVGSKPILAYPGNNIITFNYSSFADRPDVNAFIRKKYL